MQATRRALTGFLFSSQLDDFQLDTLTKYVYRCMIHSEDSKKLLAWHAACVEKGGLGTIMRAFAERKTVI